MKNFRNTLMFYGERGDIDFMLEAIKDKDNPFSFEKVIPMPSFLPVYGFSFDKKCAYTIEAWKKDTYDGTLCGWGTWRKLHWGCTRDNTKETCSVIENGLEFVTQHAAPLPVIKELAVLFPRIEFRYRCTNDNGEVIQDVVYKFGRIIEAAKEIRSEYIKKDKALQILCDDCENKDVCEDYCGLAKKVIDNDNCYDVKEIVRCHTCIRRETCGNPRKMDGGYFCQYGDRG